MNKQVNIFILIGLLAFASVVLSFCSAVGRSSEKAEKRKRNIAHLRDFLVRSGERGNSIREMKIKIDFEETGIVWGSKETVLHFDLSMKMDKLLRKTVQDYTICNKEIVIEAKEYVKIRAEKVHFIIAHVKATKITFKNISFQRDRKKQIRDPEDVKEKKQAKKIKSINFEQMKSVDIDEILSAWELPSLAHFKVEQSDCVTLNLLETHLMHLEIEEITLKALKDLVIINSKVLRKKSLRVLALLDIPFIDKVGYYFLKEILPNIKQSIFIDGWLFEKVNINPRELVISAENLIISLPTVTRIDNTLQFTQRKLNNEKISKGIVKAANIIVCAYINTYTLSESVKILQAWLNIFLFDTEKVTVSILCNNKPEELHKNIKLVKTEDYMLVPHTLASGTPVEWLVCASIVDEFVHYDQIMMVYGSLSR